MLHLFLLYSLCAVCVLFHLYILNYFAILYEFIEKYLEILAKNITIYSFFKKKNYIHKNYHTTKYTFSEIRVSFSS